MKKDQPTRLRLVKAMEKELNYKRFLHSMGVAETAAALAMRYDADIEQAEIAGILHDCDKYMYDKELIRRNIPSPSPRRNMIIRLCCTQKPEQFSPRRNMRLTIRKFWRRSAITPPESRQ